MCYIKNKKWFLEDASMTYKVPVEDTSSDF